MTGLPLLFDGQPRRLRRRGRARHYWVPGGVGPVMRTVCRSHWMVLPDEVRGTEQGHPVCARCFAVVERYERRQAAHATAAPGPMRGAV